MKKSIVCFLILGCVTFFGNNIFAQDNKEPKTLFTNSKPLSIKDLRFFVSPSVGFTQMDGSAASLLNWRSGVTLKDKFSVGAYFNTSVNQIMPKSERLPNIYMDFWTVGGFVEYTIVSTNVAHLTFPLYIGYGEVQMDNENGDAGLGESNFLKVEPSALLEINLNKNIRFNVGAGYRIIGQMNYRNFDQSAISGITGYVGLKFGLFR